MDKFDNTIYIKKNDDKQGNQPDFKGGLTVNGESFTLSLWLNDETKKSWASGKISKWEPKPHDDEMNKPASITIDTFTEMDEPPF